MKEKNKMISDEKLKWLISEGNPYVELYCTALNTPCRVNKCPYYYECDRADGVIKTGDIADALKELQERRERESKE